MSVLKNWKYFCRLAQPVIPIYMPTYHTIITYTHHFCQVYYLPGRPIEYDAANPGASEREDQPGEAHDDMSGMRQSASDGEDAQVINHTLNYVFRIVFISPYCSIAVLSLTSDLVYSVFSDLQEENDGNSDECSCLPRHSVCLFITILTLLCASLWYDIL